MLGYVNNYTSYKLLDPTSMTIFVTRHVKFFENYFSYNGKLSGEEVNLELEQLPRYVKDNFPQEDEEPSHTLADKNLNLDETEETSDRPGTEETSVSRKYKTNSHINVNNILGYSRREKTPCSNLVTNTTHNPKTYQEAINSDNHTEWKKNDKAGV